MRLFFSFFCLSLSLLLGSGLAAGGCQSSGSSGSNSSSSSNSSNRRRSSAAASGAAALTPACGSPSPILLGPTGPFLLASGLCLLGNTTTCTRESILATSRLGQYFLFLCWLAPTSLCWRRFGITFGLGINSRNKMLAREIAFFDCGAILGAVGTTSLSGGNGRTSGFGHGVVQDLEPLFAQIERFLAPNVVKIRVCIGRRFILGNDRCVGGNVSCTQ